MIRIGIARGVQRRCHRHDAGRRRDHNASVAAMLAEAAHGPLEQVVAAGASAHAQSRQPVKVGESREIDVGIRHLEAAGRPDALLPERRDGERELRVAARERRTGVRHLEEPRRPVKRSVQGGEAIVVEPRHLGGELASEIVTALEEMERPVEAAVAAERPILAREEDLADTLEMHSRFHLVRHLRKFVEVEISVRRALGAVARDVDSVEVQLRAVDEEVGAEVGPHRHEVLDGNQSAVKLRGAVVTLRVVDHEVDVRGDDAPGRLVILVGELSAVRVQVLQRGRETPGPLGLVLVVTPQPQEVIAVGPFLDEHLPVGHLDRGDHELWLPRKRLRPIHRDRQLLCGEQRTVSRLEPSDREVVDLESSSRNPDRQAADMDVPLRVIRGLALCQGADRRAEIDPEGHEHGGPQDRQRDGDPDPHVLEETKPEEPGDQSHGSVRDDNGEQCTSLDGLTFPYEQLADGAGPCGAEFVFHLHGFDNHDRLSRLHGVARARHDANDLSRHRRDDSLGSGGSRGVVGRPPPATRAEAGRDRDSIDQQCQLPGHWIGGGDHLMSLDG
jgi:hypothetical protein